MSGNANEELQLRRPHGPGHDLAPLAALDNRHGRAVDQGGRANSAPSQPRRRRSSAATSLPLALPDVAFMTAR